MTTTPAPPYHLAACVGSAELDDAVYACLVTLKSPGPSAPTASAGPGSACTTQPPPLT